MRILALLPLLLLSGCNEEMQQLGQQSDRARPIAASDNPRFSAARVGVFRDDLAYNGMRGVYVFKDAQTGAEFFGISGVGIAELGSHKVGKSIIKDER